jgi:hypothetical protein
MAPKFASELAWQQAEVLMQPIYIRIIGRIGTEAENSTLKVSYEEEQTPHITHFLCLSDGGRQLRVNIWDLCYRVCFTNYQGSHPEVENTPVDVDLSLLDRQTSDVDWQALEAKAATVVRSVFDSFK